MYSFSTFGLLVVHNHYWGSTVYLLRWFTISCDKWRVFETVHIFRTKPFLTKNIWIFKHYYYFSLLPVYFHKTISTFYHALFTVSYSQQTLAMLESLFFISNINTVYISICKILINFLSFLNWKITSNKNLQIF